MMGSDYVNGKQRVLIKHRARTNIFATTSASAIVMAITTSVVFLSTITHAAPAPITNTANTLKVSPVRTDIQIPAGTTKTVTTTVTNLTGGQITVTPIENDFVAGDERGTPSLILDANSYAPTHSLKRFMRPLQNLTIAPKQSRSINVTITVPKDAQAGGYFGAIRFAPTSPDGGGQVNLSASVASIILMTVPGPTTEKVDLTNFDVQQNGRSSGYFQTPNDLKVAFRMKNSGNVQEGPFGKISVKKGNEVVYETDFNNKDQRDMILPDSARRWEVPLDKIGTFGHYAVYATFTYGSSNQTIDVVKRFWVVPTSYIIGAIIGLVLLLIIVAIAIWLIIRSVKKHKHGKGNTFGAGYRH